MFLVGCETFPEKRYEDQLLEEAHFMEQTTEGDTCIDDSIKTEPSNTEPELGGFDFFLEDPIAVYLHPFLRVVNVPHPNYPTI